MFRWPFYGKAILAELRAQRHILEKIMVDTSKLESDFATLGTVVTTALTDLTNLSAQITDLKSQLAGALDPAAQAKVDAVDTSVLQLIANVNTGISALSNPPPAPPADPGDPTT